MADLADYRVPYDELQFEELLGKGGALLRHTLFVLPVLSLSFIATLLCTSYFVKTALPCALTNFLFLQVLPRFSAVIIAVTKLPSRSLTLQLRTACLYLKNSEESFGYLGK